MINKLKQMIEDAKLRAALRDCVLAREMEKAAGRKAYGLVPARVDVYARIQKSARLFK